MKLSPLDTVEEPQQSKIKTVGILENDISIHLGGLEYLGNSI